MNPIKIAAITGGHPFDVQPFHQLFRSLPGVDPYIQHTEQFASEPEDVRDGYEAVVVYSMLKETPSDEGPWYAGKQKTAFERLVQRGQGIVILHHGILAYPDWPLWDDITGMQARRMRSYHQNERVAVEISEPQHPIVQGCSPWEMIDETYRMDGSTMPEDIPGNSVFLTTGNPQSIKPLGWTRQCGQSKVFCFVSGHGYATYENPGFQNVLANGIHWVSKGGL
jgi:uncharacterized protein